MNHFKSPPDSGWDAGQLTAVVEPVYPDDEPPRLDEAAVLKIVVARLLEFIFRKPWGKTPERRLIVLGIALGVQELRGRTLEQFAREQNISKKNASEYMRRIREHFGIEANNFSTAAFRRACRRGANKRWHGKT